MISATTHDPEHMYFPISKVYQTFVGTDSNQRHDLEENFEYLFDAILVYYDHLESARDFNNGNLGYITRSFDNIYDSIFSLWGINNY